jgi:hypothetical protein
VLESAIEGFFDAEVKLTIFLEEFLRDLFDVKTVLQLRKGRIMDIIFDNRNETALGSVSRFVLADKERVSSRGSKLLRGFDSSARRLDNLVFHLHQRETPILCIRCNEGDQRRILQLAPAAAIEVPRYEVPLHSAGMFKRGFLFEPGDKKINLLSVRVLILAEALKRLHVGLVSVRNVVATINERRIIEAIQ